MSQRPNPFRILTPEEIKMTHRTIDPTESVLAGYLEAIFATETGDTAQPDEDATLTALSHAEAWQACRGLVWGLQGLIANTSDKDLEDDIKDALSGNPHQLGIDLWLTRNGHGAGFWDRPELYGKQLSDILTAMATVLGSHDVCFDCQTEPDPVPTVTIEVDSGRVCSVKVSHIDKFTVEIVDHDVDPYQRPAGSPPVLLVSATSPCLWRLT